MAVALWSHGFLKRFISHGHIRMSLACAQRGPAQANFYKKGMPKECKVVTVGGSPGGGK